MAALGTRHPGRGTRARARAVTTCELNDPVSKELVGQGLHTKKRATCTAARKCALRKRALAAGLGTHVGASCVCVAAALNAARSALPDLPDGALQQCTLRRLSVGARRAGGGEQTLLGAFEETAETVEINRKRLLK